MDEAEHGRTGLVGFLKRTAFHRKNPAIAVDPVGAEVVIACPAAGAGEVNGLAALGAFEKMSGAADVALKMLVFHESGSLQ